MLAIAFAWMVFLVSSSTSVGGETPCWKMTHEAPDTAPPDVICRGGSRCCGPENKDCCPLYTPPANSSLQNLLPSTPVFVVILYIAALVLVLWLFCRTIIFWLRRQSEDEETSLVSPDDGSKLYFKSPESEHENPIHTFTLP